MEEENERGERGKMSHPNEVRRQRKRIIGVNPRKTTINFSMAPNGKMATKCYGIAVW